MDETILTQQEKKWIEEQRITRLSDNQEVLIYPMGAERFLSTALFGNKQDHYEIRKDIEGKDILVIPGYGNSAFLFAQAGASSVTVYDKDPVTIAWIKAFKKFYHYRQYDDEGRPYPSIGELLDALTRWYPPLISLPSGRLSNFLYWVIYPKTLRRVYIYYMLSIVREAIEARNDNNFELDQNIEFHVGELSQLVKSSKKQIFDTAFIPYLLGVRNGIEKEKEIVDFISQLVQIVPKGHILVSPSRNSKEFYITGQRYFITSDYPNIQSIPGLKPYFLGEDRYWFRTQGLAVFGSKQS